MVTLIPAEINELYELVKIGFGSDSDLIDKYQQFPGDFEAMVNRNVQNIGMAAVVMDLKVFCVNKDETDIGFTVIDNKRNILYSFGINGNYRTREIVQTWFERVKELFDDRFYCSLWNQNIRAIEFLKRNGMKVFNKDNFITYLIYT